MVIDFDASRAIMNLRRAVVKMAIRGNDYWDLLEKERAELTRDEVQAYLSFELMQKGCLEPEPLELAPVPEVKMPTEDVYCLRFGLYSRVDIAFRSEEDARLATQHAPLFITCEYVGESVVCLAEASFTVECVKLPTKASVDAARFTLKEASVVKADNDRRTRDHAEATKKAEAALKGLWEDWHAQRETAERVAKVEATFVKYTTLADGATELAKKFLRQVFRIEELQEAETWSGKDYGTVVGDEYEYEEVGVPAEENHVATGTQAF
jgi:hypothetical protein